MSAEADWKYSFTDLAKYDKSGEEIEYTVEEADVPEGYDVEVDGNNITNTQKTTEVTGEKTWEEVDERYRPDSVTVELFANGEKESEAEVKAEADWKYSFTDLAKYDKSGEEIEYTVEETNAPQGYDTEIDGFNITNIQKVTEVSGSKTWLDDNSKNRPNSITVQVMNGDEVVDTTKVTAKDDWSYSFKDLPKYDSQGEEIKYTIDEEDVEGYKKSIDGHDITNLRVGTTKLDITKHWEDEGDADRPDAIKVNLLQNGDFYQEYEVTKDNDWKLSIEDLPEFDTEGKIYNYTVKEQDVAGYDSDVSGFDITNTRADTKDIEITKTWLDDESKDRPDSIEVELFRSVTDGDKELVDTYTLTAKNDWKLGATDLPSFDKDGKAYMYEVKEKEVPTGYESTVNGFDITNLRVDTTNVKGSKTWLDDKSEDRPDSITVYLLANGEKVEDSETTVTADNDWNYEFSNLSKYDSEGKEIKYTVDEAEVDGYEKTIERYDITNLRVGTTDVNGEKTWLNDNSKSRPESITVHLLANGDKIATQIVTAEMDWKYSFTDLPMYDENGVAIDYAVSEVEVDGYKSSIDGFDITNTFMKEDDETPKDPDQPEDPNETETSKDPDNSEAPKGSEDKKEPVAKDDTGSNDNMNDPDQSETSKDKVDDKEDATSDNALPSTATNTFSMMLIGLLMIAGGTGLAFYRRKMQ